ncbi:cilia- and flagella-associated protein 263 [Myripristis murdjan]|uniref:cilia- and flagella-associated protein 263 n=1 Tax=Myripristis murdjan TaxID=586833 RepID=UPI001175D2B4|nr:coiled-coil domain-containing protein 113 [Myripristis murdjan]
MEPDLSGMEKKVSQMGREALSKRVEELRRSNEFLLAENDMFERFISRLDPRDLAPPAAEGIRGAGASQLDVGGHARRQRSQSNMSDRLQQLTLEQKCYVAQREVEETQKDLEKLKRRSELTQDNYKATLEEAEIRLAEIRRAKCDFERDVVKPLREKKADMMGPEKVLRYIENKIKSKSTQVDKLRLKNQALRVQARKLQLQLKQKKEKEDTVHETDFWQYQEQSDNQDLDLMQAQKNAVKAQQTLNSCKEKLQTVSSECKQLSCDITSRKEMLVKIEEETQRVEEERSKAEALNKKLRRRLTDYHVPDVLEYIRVKDKNKELERSLKTWERKVEIAEMASKTNTRAWDKQVAALVSGDNAEAGAGSGAYQSTVRFPNIGEPWTSARHPSN